MKYLSAALFGLVLVISSGCGADSGSSGGGPEVIGPLDLSTDILVTDSLIIDGDLTISGTAVMEVDLSRTGGRLFQVNGNVLVKDTARLYVHGHPAERNDRFIIANDLSEQRSFATQDDSEVQIDDIEFRTQTGTAMENGSIYMSYSASGTSRMLIGRAFLETEACWLLGTFRDGSVLQAVDTVHVPTEIYVEDASDVSISGPDTQTGAWLTFESGTNVLDLPDQSGPYDWEVSPGAGHSVTWRLAVTDALVGLGIKVLPWAMLTVNGRGTPVFGEATIGYFPNVGGETIDGLTVGLQNTTVGGRLTLNNVHLGPIAWQIYVATPDPVIIQNSIVNEIGIVAGADVTVDNCVLQLAVLACLAADSTLTIRNSDIWNQYVLADGNAAIGITGCTIYGCLFNAAGAASQIAIADSVFHENPASMEHLHIPMVDFVTGYPNYNPFRVPGPAAAVGAGTIITSGCTDAPF